MYLAIDTSTEIAGLALAGEDKILAKLTWQCEQSHSTQLLPELVRLLDQAQLKLQSARGIIVARGPGSYNGLRVGLSTAKGLAFSLSIPIVGISSLEAEAYRHVGIGRPVCSILNAGRGEIATALYQNKQNGWQQLTAEHITTVENLCTQITEQTIFCGEFVPTIAPQIRELLGEKAVIQSADSGQPRVISLARLGVRRLRAGDYDHPATLQPLYLRRPAITQPKHR
jgi:tRNA threonylcarbamoyl adenosine modification protein YeaZ